MAALLGPTNTGKTHRAVQQMLSHRTGIMGLPLRLLAREVYDRVTTQIGERSVALVTGEEKRIPKDPRYWICTVESMPLDREVDFVCVDEIQLAAHPQRGHTFTQRLLHARGERETWFLGSEAMRPRLEELLPTAVHRRHARFSKLSYIGAQSVGSVPPRTAVVGFSVAEVYELAERLRQHHGGTAVVLGALSPRTRNAQVAMFEAGEVQHMVATDAIGMGLNLNLDRVLFASLAKFDGREHRPLHTDELAQIAGRAGRYTRDGSFGVLRPLTGIGAGRVHAVENHKFRPIGRLQWRNCELDFRSVAQLLDSLRQRPPRRCLQLVSQADDYNALVQLSKLDGIRKFASSPEAVELLWDVCRIPDFRKLLLESHVHLLGEIFSQLCGEHGRLDEDWMAGRIDRLDDIDGDIDTLMGRIAFIRTWTYIAHHERWVAQPDHWQERTRGIEDRQSDALHERLTERFVGAGAPARVYSTARVRARPRQPKVVPTPLDPASPFGVLANLAVPGVEVEHTTDLAEDIDTADDTAFSLNPEGHLAFRGTLVAKLFKGSDVLSPDVRVVVPELRAGALRRVRRRLVAWIRDTVERALGRSEELVASPSPPIRGLVYQLRQGLGAMTVGDMRKQFRALSATEQGTVQAAGVVLGRYCVYLPEGLEAAAVVLRRALHVAYCGDAKRVPTLTSDTALADPTVDRATYLVLGYLVCGPVALRIDKAERAFERLADFASVEDAFELPDSFVHWLGCERQHLPAVLKTLGARSLEGGLYGL